MVIYIESVFAFNVLVDYLLLFGAARVAGRTVARRRLLLGDGGAYAGLWCEGCEKGEKHEELAQNAVA